MGHTLALCVARGAASPVVGRTLCTPAARVRFPGWASIILGLKTWLSTLEIVNLSGAFSNTHCPKSCILTMFRWWFAGLRLLFIGTQITIVLNSGGVCVGLRRFVMVYIVILKKLPLDI